MLFGTRVNQLKSIGFRRIVFILQMVLVALCGWIATPTTCWADEKPANGSSQNTEQIEFFEKHIRPVLVAQCYECHNSGDESESSLALDHRKGLRVEGDYGPIVDLKHPDKSVLLKVIRHEIEDLKMPQAGAKLSPETIANFERWVKMGAPDPRDNPPAAEQIKKATSWEAISKKRQQWWSFQPIRKHAPPQPGSKEVSDHAVDRWIRAELREKKLQSAPQADRRTLIRRLSFVLTGLPPTPEQIDAFLENDSPHAWEQLVDRLIASPHYGEHWARHWMDWVRYTETHGSEGDPAIPHAYRYRDYLIRALNADIPYDQLVREHIAGDLLDNPRINNELGINESAIGTAQWRMVFHGFSPTDALDEKVRFTDDQINVVSKAFLALTVSCARCHDHKFDAISQSDYYALFGILNSTRPALIDVNTKERQTKHQTRLTQLKAKIRQLMASVWLKQIDELPDVLMESFSPGSKSDERIKQRQHALHPWSVLVNQAKNKDDNFSQRWDNFVEKWEAKRKQFDKANHDNVSYRWDLSDPKVVDQWFADGNGLQSPWSAAGEFTVGSSSNGRVVSGIYPAGVYSHRLSTKHRGLLASPRFHLGDESNIWLNVIGDNGAISRYIVQNYPRTGTIYPGGSLRGANWHWKRFDVGHWTGDDLHIELSTVADAPIIAQSVPRSWFGIREAVVFRKKTVPPVDDRQTPLAPLLTVASRLKPDSPLSLAKCYATALETAILAWQDETMTDDQAFLVDTFLREGLLQNRIDQLPMAEVIFAEYNRLENEIPEPTRVPGLLEADASDHPLFIRGNHKQPGEPVPRRFLEAIDDTGYKTAGSGRLELANSILSPDNPFTARVVVNRVWNYVFGQGIVPTIDNFGRLGELPSHPELLDELAIRFANEGWSIKRLVKYLVMSETWQQSSDPSPLAMKLDPANRLLSHANLRRLEAESIRDAILSVSGQLKPTLYGPGVPADGNEPRRSVYITIRRNSLNPLLSLFDAPVPFSTKGRRDVTNVPAQSLALLNDPFVIRAAQQWAKRNQQKATNEVSRLKTLFVQALGREPTDSEINSARQFMTQLDEDYRAIAQQRGELTQQIQLLQSQIDSLLEPARKRILAERGLEQTNPAADLDPIAVWDFEENAHDLVGDLHGTLKGTAKIDEGALVLDGKGYVATKHLKHRLAEKSLEAWVIVDGLDQRGGGVVTVQNQSGQFFDSIVFGEMKPGHWLAGSNFFERTLDFGAATTEADRTAIHIVITYATDGTIRGYRNGKSYGKPIRKSALRSFKENTSQILFGLRHSPAGGNRYFKGRILEARLYDRSLGADEVDASFSGDGHFVSQRTILAELNKDQLASLKQMQMELAKVKKREKELPETADEYQVWADLGHAIFNLKEFIYLR